MYKSSAPGSPLISIVTAVLNRAECVENLIRSIRAQSYQHIELVVIDGGSTDGTLDVLRRNEDVVDYWRSEVDDGVYDALNKGITFATGEWINIQGADDVLLNEYSVIPSSLCDRRTVYCADLLLLGSMQTTSGRLTEFGLVRRQCAHHAMFFPKEFFKQYSYDLRYTVAADYVLIVQSFMEKKFVFEHVPLTVALFDDVNGMSARLIDTRLIENTWSIYRRYFSFSLVLLMTIRLLLINLCMTLNLDMPLKALLNRCFGCRYSLRVTVGFSRSRDTRGDLVASDVSSAPLFLPTEKHQAPDKIPV